MAMHSSDRSRPGHHAAHAETAILPPGIDAVIFDLDGVITDTRRAHEDAWAQLFDSYRDERAAAGQGAYAPFTADDYREYLDGKPRYDGVRDFLASRGIDLPWGDPGDDPDMLTICGLGNRKNRHFAAWLGQNRVDVYPGALAFLRRLRAAGIRTAIISSSMNCAAVLANAGIADMFDVKVDGNDMAALDLPGKPDPTIFLRAAGAMGVTPERTAVVEDALAGIEAGRRGGFALVVGVDRQADGRHGPRLRTRGADIVTDDLHSLLGAPAGQGHQTPATAPSLWDHEDAVMARLRGAQVAVFLDYDGTLTPIVVDPAQAGLDEEMRAVLRALAALDTVAVLSGRDLEDLRARVGLDDIWYAGSHGFDIAGPQRGPEGGQVRLQHGRDYLPDLDAAGAALRRTLADIPGAQAERKAFAIAVHYRQVPPDGVPQVEAAVAEVMRAHADRLRLIKGKKVFDLRPLTDWDKGHALLWLLGELGLEGPQVVPVCIGDDVTDEDAFRVLRGPGPTGDPGDRGIGIVLRDDDDRTTMAHYALDGTAGVARFLRLLTALCDRGETS